MASTRQARTPSKSSNGKKLCLVAGATGYVGGRLVPELLDRGYAVRVLARSPEKLRDLPWADSVEIVAGDAGDPESALRALSGAHVAYYLMHSIQAGPRLEETEAGIAGAFAAAAKAGGVGRIVYLGGLVPPLPESEMSPHMRSRAAVGRILRESGVPTVEFRASVIIGSGSASFEMLRYLTEHLPAMITPKWVRQRTQPIAIRDVLRYLVAAAELPPEVNRVLEIGGPEVLTYQEMMHAYARVAGLRPRIIVPVPLLTPRLSGLWINLVTPVPRDIAMPLVESLRHPAVCSERDVAQWIPDDPPVLSFEAALELALARVRDSKVTTRWSDSSLSGAPSDPMPSDPEWSGGTVYRDVREGRTAAPPERVWAAVQAIGGERGWYSSSALWRLRGLADRLVGGVGLRRGRRDPLALRVGDAVDLWRVEERISPRVLRLRAEMKMPGRAWLEFDIAPTDKGGSVLRQRALFLPAGLGGHLYWWAVAPFHAFVFPVMVRHILAEAELAASGAEATS